MGHNDGSYVQAYVQQRSINRAKKSCKNAFCHVAKEVKRNHIKHQMIGVAVYKAGANKSVVLVVVLNGIRVKNHFAEHVWFAPSPEAHQSRDYDDD